MRINKRSNKVWKVIGSVWASVLVLSLLSVTLPGISHATDQDAGSIMLQIEVGETFIINAPLELDVNLQGTEINSAVTAVIDVGVTTSMPTGYIMYLSMADGDMDSGALVHDTINAARIPSVTGNFLNPTALTETTWGYNLQSFGADNYAAIPDFATPDEIARENTAGAFNTPIEIGVWAGFIPAGHYSNSITVLVTANT